MVYTLLMREKNIDYWLYLLEVVHELGHARLINKVRRVTCLEAHFCGAGARGADCVCVRERVCVWYTYIHTYIQTYIQTYVYKYIRMYVYRLSRSKI